MATITCPYCSKTAKLVENILPNGQSGGTGFSCPDLTCPGARSFIK